MPVRIVKRDQKGMYLLVDRRKYYWSPATAVMGAVTMPLPGQPVNYWTGRSRKQSIPHYLFGRGNQRWETNDPYVAPKPKPLKVKPPGQNQILIRKNYKGAQVLITVAEKKARHAGRQKVTPLAISMNAAAFMEWDEWDALVEEINNARAEVPLISIVAGLQAEVEAEDALQDYILKHGLA